MNASTNFFATNEEVFDGMFGNRGNMGGGDGLGNNFMMGNEWDMSGALGAGGGSGITPMGEGVWNQMLDSIDMNWDGMGPVTLHGTDPTNR